MSLGPSFLQLLLQTRLTQTSKFGQNDLLQDQVKVMVAGCDFCSLELLRLRSHSPVSHAAIPCCIMYFSFQLQDVCGFRSQLKELEVFNSDVRQACRKVSFVLFLNSVSLLYVDVDTSSHTECCFW